MQAPMQDFALYKCTGHYLPNSGSNHLIQVGAHLIQVALCTSYKQLYTSLIQDTRHTQSHSLSMAIIKEEYALYKQ